MARVDYSHGWSFVCSYCLPLTVCVGAEADDVRRALDAPVSAPHSVSVKFASSATAPIAASPPPPPPPPAAAHGFSEGVARAGRPSLASGYTESRAETEALRRASRPVSAYAATRSSGDWGAEVESRGMAASAAAVTAAAAASRPVSAHGPPRGAPQSKLASLQHHLANLVR
jgi:hypothetical protein